MLALKKRFVGLVTAAAFSAIGIAMMAGIAGSTSTAEGFFYRPELDDEVVIAFEHGDVRMLLLPHCTGHGHAEIVRLSIASGQESGLMAWSTIVIPDRNQSTL